ncbi:hypothetical protein FHQ23_11920 [Testudinibacter sp. TR-2022]|uniref:oligosaccharide flippase family protein n=1 Tax=Testudinibacter sp. TR-2022 TaxID=2585029 RepID=UPI00111AF388|nr:oligosaccharide flippase family protein [Testudinibacter sp. TR-2022]TNH13521.1 hypothetical protein FHQ23_11920 [Testudinibacter sp. TR-2022]
MKKIVSNIGWLLLEHGSRLIFALLSTSLLARGLGVEQYGLFQYALNLILVFMSISFICGAEVIVPMLVNASAKRRRLILGNAFYLRLFFSILAYVFLVSFVYISNTREQFYLILILGLILLVSEAFSVVTAWLQSQTNIKPKTILVISTSLIKCLIVALLFFFNVVDPIYYAFAWVFEAGFIAFGLICIYKNISKSNFFYFSKPMFFYLLKKGFPFFIALLLMYSFLRLDVIMLRHFSDLVTLGLYTSANQLLLSIVAVSPILAMSLAPAFVYEKSIINIKRNIIYITIFMVVVSLLIAVIMNYLSPIIIPLLFGHKFNGAIPIFSYFLWVMTLYFINEGLNVYFIRMQLGRMLIFKWLLVLLGALIAYWYFIPLYGAYGAIIGYSIGYSVACIFSVCVMFLDSNKFISAAV